MQSIEPDSIWVRTNPVWSYREFIRKEKAKGRESRALQFRVASWLTRTQAEGVRFPSNAWKDFFCLYPAPVWEPPTARPGVIGLLKGDEGGLDQPTGFVTQITATDSLFGEGWQANRLPFQAHHIQDALYRLVNETGVDFGAVIPEARAFTLSDSLKQSPNGSSINISALLAVIDSWNENGRSGVTDLLRCCCSFVKPKDNELRAVGSVREKLEAFLREYIRGTLVVCTPSTAKEHELQNHFDVVWPVESFADLGKELLEAGLLKALLSQHEISLNAVLEAGRAIERIRKSEGGIEAALKFAYRMQKAVDQGGAATIRVSQRANEALENVHRHIGNFSEAYQHSRLAVDLLNKLGEHASFQEIAEANARLGAAMFDAHMFAEGVGALADLVKEASDQPRLLSAESRVMLFNTQARLLSAAGIEGWEPLFRKSLQLQKLVEPSSIARTRCYMVHAFLRNRSPIEARTELAWFETNTISVDSMQYVHFYRAELYRRDPSCGPEYRQNDEFEKTGRNHAFAFYLQATARQSDRNPEERDKRLRKSSEVMMQECGCQNKGNLLHLISLFIDLVLGGGNDSRIQSEIDQIFASSGANALRDWYRDSLELSPKDPDSLFNRIPYF